MERTVNRQMETVFVYFYSIANHMEPEKKKKKKERKRRSGADTANNNKTLYFYCGEY